MRTILLILAIWLLFNVLFVMVVLPSRRRIPPPRPSEPLAINKITSRLEEDMPPSLGRVIVSAATRVLFVLVLPFVQAWEAISGRFRGHHD